MKPVIIGMDPHQRSATIEVIDDRERVLFAGRFGTDWDGSQAMLAAGRKFPGRTWAVEGCNGIGRHIAQRLVADGEPVVDVPAKLSARARVFSTGQGPKTDPGRCAFGGAGRAGGHRADAAKSPADSGGGDPSGRGGSFPGAAQVCAARSGEPELGMCGDDEPGPPIGGGRGADPGGGTGNTSLQRRRGMSRASAASHTRSAGSYRTRLTWRRSTAFSCRSTSSSAFFAWSLPNIRTARPSIRHVSMYTILSSTGSASHHRVQAAGDDAGQPLNRVLERHRFAFMAKWNHVPALETYRQMAIRQQKTKDYSKALCWAERGLTLYGDDSARPEAVEDLRNRAAGYRSKLLGTPTSHSSKDSNSEGGQTDNTGQQRERQG
jgi:hypothetical protein